MGFCGIIIIVATACGLYRVHIFRMTADLHRGKDSVIIPKEVKLAGVETILHFSILVDCKFDE